MYVFGPNGAMAQHNTAFRS